MTRGKLLDNDTMFSFFIFILMMTLGTQKTEDRTDSRNVDFRNVDSRNADSRKKKPVTTG